MNNSALLAIATSVVPILAISFVGVLLVYKIFIKLRSRFDATVNCWFCNQNARVPYLESNSWTCPHCEQYNGFTKDGDYNKEMFQQLDCSMSQDKLDRSGISELLSTSLPAQNGFCNVCNEAQRLKVEKLAEFEPKKESKFDAELKIYKTHLEEQYRLCVSCERHLKKVLREKKKMVLGSKFLDFIIKGAETLKQPHFQQLHHIQQQAWKRKFALLITLFTLVNMFCLANVLPSLKRESITGLFGDTLGHRFFLALSHAIAFVRVLAAYFEGVSRNATLVKVGLFLRTIFLMVLYSMGLKLPNIARFNYTSLYVLICPFAILSLAFGHNVMDGFKLTRFTVLLLLWSVFAGGLVNEHLIWSQNTLMFIASFVTFLLSVSSRTEPSPKLHDNSANSFHKIYSEEYLSDEDSISLLSQQLSNSASSFITNRSFCAPSSRQVPLNSSRFTKSPLTSSLLSLHNRPRSQLSPNSSYKSFCLNGPPTMQRAPYASSMYNFAVGRAPATVFASDLELNCRQRPQSVLGLNNKSEALNSSFGNSVFNKPQPYDHTAPYAQHVNRNGLSTKGESAFGNPMALHSPFSASSGSIYPNRQTNLLSPSRFSTNSLNSHTPSAAWLSGGYFNQQQPMLPSFATLPHINPFEPRNVQACGADNMSSTSSQSSGFESQSLNASRENSSGPEVADTMSRTLVNDSFQPIEHAQSAFSPHPLMYSNVQPTTPLAIDCSASVAHARKDSWRMPAARKYMNGCDSFNLRKINEELPTMKPGDLLRKWKQSQPTY